MTVDEALVHKMLAEVEHRGGTLLASYVGIVGLIVAALRQRKGWSQSRLARESDISQPTISRIETGECAITLQQVAQLAAVLDTTPGALAGMADEMRAVLERQSIDVPPRELEAPPTPRKGHPVFRTSGPLLEGPLGGFAGAMIGAIIRNR